MFSFYYLLSHSIDWHLLDIMYNILNMQRYATPVAGQAANISASMKTFHCYDIVSQYNLTDMASLPWPTSRVGETCYENVWTAAGFCDIKNLPRRLNRHTRSKNHIQNQIASKTSGKARIDFGFERTAKTKYQRSQCWGKGKPRDFERPH